ncbi:MAG TPA: hypothetical protein PKE03_07680 [Bacteroidales bacterium]|nr:hypothetical protein [Bacteroidales bacterium]
MMRKFNLILIIFISWLSAVGQVETFAYRSDALEVQLLHIPTQRLAALSWKQAGRPGFALLQPSEPDQGQMEWRQADGHALLSGAVRENLIEGLISIGGETLAVKLEKTDNPYLNDWRFIRSEGSYRHKNDRGTGAIIELNYYFPDHAGHSLIPVLASFYGLDAQLAGPEAMMQADVDAFVDRYRQTSTSAEGNTLDMNWMKSATGFPVFVSGQLLCLAKTSAVSTGSGSMRNHADYTLIDLGSNRRLTFEDIFRAYAKEELSALLGTALKSMFMIESGTELRQAGFFVDKVLPNENILLGAGALGFAYNVYELGPPSKGQPVVMLPFEAIEHLLQPAFAAQLRVASGRP